MSPSTKFLSPSQAAKQLGISTKALRLYEQQGLIAPLRSEAGWRAYGPDQMRRATQIVALRSLGFSLTQIGRVLSGDAHGLDEALAAHQVVLEGQAWRIAGTVEKLRGLRHDLASCKTNGQPTGAEELLRRLAPVSEPVVAFALPWPWGGEGFELRDIRPLNYIVGPLFSGKTKLAAYLAEKLPGAAFLGLDRLTEEGGSARAELDADPAVNARVEEALSWLVEDGAESSNALLALLVALHAEGPTYLVIDLIEEGLDGATQRALIAYLRQRGEDATPLFLITRSCEILDLEAVGPQEAIILCPANHSPPSWVAPYPGAAGYEAVATCLAAPEVRARSQGVIAWRPPTA